MANSNATVPDFNALVRSEPFVRGVRDYHAGVWMDYRTPWDASSYESGRLAAAERGSKSIDIVAYFYALEGGAFPPSLGANNERSTNSLDPVLLLEMSRLHFRRRYR